MSFLNHLKSQIETTFEKDPYRFFTEHDIHTELALIATDYLKKNGKLLTETKDKRIVSRVHHEYPTPFRCDMNELNFKVIPEDEFERKRQARGMKMEGNLIQIQYPLLFFGEHPHEIIQKRVAIQNKVYSLM